MRIRLNLSQLVGFLKLAEMGDFGDAALALGVTKSSLSRTIRGIETRLNVRLFDDGTGGVALTPAGEKLRRLAGKIIDDHCAAFDEFEDFTRGRRGHIRIACLPSLSSAFLPQTIAHFQERYPGVRIDIWEDVTVPVHRAVSEGTVDLGLVTPPRPNADLFYRPLVKDEIVLVCRSDDVLASDQEHEWTIFKERPFIGMSLESGLRGMVDNAFAQAGLAVEPLYNSKSLATIGSLITASLGISALPLLTLAHLGSDALTWRRLRQPTVSRSIGIVTLAARSLSPAARHFVRELTSRTRRLSPILREARSLR